MDLALAGKTIDQIGEALEESGMGEFLNFDELQFIVSEAKFAKRIMPARPGRIIPRLIGITAILLGLVGIWIGREGPHVRGYSPGGYGLVAIILGSILIFKPSSSREQL
jgi:hypothetical protein